MSTLLVVTDDRLGPTMAGPAIRAMHLAAELAPEHDVRLVSTAGCDLVRVDVDCRHVPYDGLRAQVEWADIVLVPPFAFEHAPWLTSVGAVVIVDLYDPVHLEQLARSGIDAAGRRARVNNAIRVLNAALDRGDYFLTASEKQRAYWLGALTALGRVGVETYDEDPTLATRVGVVPFGLPAAPPQRSGPGLRERIAGIGPDDPVLLWAGGIYDWFDPATLIKAVEWVPEAKLVFLAAGHPDLPESATAAAARELSDSLGLTDRRVFFGAGWVPYAERADWLLDADLGVSSHAPHLETTFSYRTRMLDYLWAGLPMVSTAGDAFAELIDAEGLGLTVPAGDPEALAGALARLLGDAELRSSAAEAVARVRGRFTWPQVAAPLADFCRTARRAPDAGRARLAVPNLAPVSVRGDLALARRYLTTGGPREVARRAGGRLARVIRPAR